MPIKVLNVQLANEKIGIPLVYWSLFIDLYLIFVGCTSMRRRCIEIQQILLAKIQHHEF
jgi:hypothetical protein